MLPLPSFGWLEDMPAGRRIQRSGGGFSLQRQRRSGQDGPGCRARTTARPGPREREETGAMNIRYATILGGLALTLAAAAAPGAAAQTKLSVTQYGKVVGSLPWAIAFEKGWLKEDGLKVESILSSDGGGTSMRNMLASDLPFGESATSAAVA